MTARRSQLDTHGQAVAQLGARHARHVDAGSEDHGLSWRATHRAHFTR